MYLKRFSDYPKIKFTIHVDHDFIMRGNKFYNGGNINRDEIDKSKCTIVGNGTISFLDNDFMDDVKTLCTYDKNKIKFNFSKTSSKINICIGQSNIDQCKSEIENISLLQDEEWIWLRNAGTLSFINNKRNIYLTDDQIIYSNYNIKLTGNANVIYYSCNSINIFNNGINYIRAQKSSAKLTLIPSFYHDYYYPYEKQVLTIYYNLPPTDVNLRIYLDYAFVKLYQYYIENFENHSVLVDGKCVIYIREPYIPMINIFKKSEDILFAINPDPDFLQICYAKNVNECTNLCDFVFANNYDKFTRNI